jgi:hypothetical protein
MASFAPAALVTGPARMPLAFGLGSVIAWREGTDRWEGGQVSWESITCEPAGGRGGPDCEATSGSVGSQTVSGDATGGTFTLTDGTNTTAPIAFDADAATIAGALTDAGIDATVMGGPLPETITITFDTPGVQDGLVVDGALLTGGSYAVDVVEAGVDPILVAGLPKTFEDGGGLGTATGFAVYGSYECLVTGNTFGHAQEMAEQHLIAREIARVEQALWTGDLGNVPNFSGANGYAAPTSAGTGTTPLEALALVEAALAAAYGSTGVIHMSHYIATLLADDLTFKGGRAFTPLGTPVVVGAGYTSKTIIVGTPALFGYRSDVIEVSNRAGDLLDRASNTMHGLAERSYLVGVDTCGIVSATFEEVEAV